MPLAVFGCHPLADSRAVSCTNGATCVANRCVCASNDTVGTLCEIGTIFSLRMATIIFICRSFEYGLFIPIYVHERDLHLLRSDQWPIALRCAWFWFEWTVSRVNGWLWR